MATPSWPVRPTPGGRPVSRLLVALVLVGSLAVTATGCSSGSTTASSAPTTNGSSSAEQAGLPRIRHVFVIVMENEGYDATFGNPSADPYLATTLPASGALLSHYYAIGHFSNDNYIALISGQAPNPSNQADCQVFADFPASATVAANGQISGSGCVFPDSVTTVADELTKAHFTWKGYMQDMGNVPSREDPVCGHPTVGSPDGTQKAVPGDGYSTRHDPFVYFHSIIDHTKQCDSNVIPLGTPSGGLPAGTPPGTTSLVTDLESVATTPNLSYIIPNLCNDGHDLPCVDQQASPSRLTNIDTFLETWVPKITSSPAFKKDGLLIVTFDEADTDLTDPTNAAACCNQIPGPAAAMPGIDGPGGGRIGTVLLSPFIEGGTTSTVPYNHYSTLASIEDIFGLSKLGQAKTVSSTFGTKLFKK